MKISVSSTLGGLERDLKTMTMRAPVEFKKVVRRTVIDGNNLAKGYAKVSAGAHGKHYPRAFTWEVNAYYAFGAGNIVGVYGPEVGRQQGEMSFERGSRNQKPHLDLSRSADVIAWTFGPSVLHAAHQLFWPGSG